MERHDDHERNDANLSVKVTNASLDTARSVLLREAQALHKLAEKLQQNDQHEPTSIRQHPPWCACQPADLVTAYSATLCQGCRRDGLHETSAVAPPSHAKEPHKTHRPRPSCL